MCDVRLFWYCLTVFLCHLPGGACFKGVIEGDETAQLYINGVYIRQTVLVTILPLNSERRHNMQTGGTWPIMVSNRLVAGDVIGLRITSNKPETVPITSPTGVTQDYPGLTAGIAAFEDGTMTNELWRCSIHAPLEWHSQAYDDSAWQKAVPQPVDCCPWRDAGLRWSRLNAKWIAPPLSQGNLSGPRSFYCRYTVPENRSRLPDSEISGMSPYSPKVTVRQVVMGTSVTQVTFNVSNTAIVSCGVVDALSELRAPTPKERQTWGESARVEPTEKRWVTVGSPSQTFTYANLLAVAWFSKPVIEECRKQCDLISGCNGIVYHDRGIDLVTGMNCKLVASLNASEAKVQSSSSLYTHEELVVVMAEHQVAITEHLLCSGSFGVSNRNSCDNGRPNQGTTKGEPFGDRWHVNCCQD